MFAVLHFNLGSQTLHQWKRLATPHLAGVLEHRPGIQTKGENFLESEYEETYSLSDYEEDGTSSKCTSLEQCVESLTDNVDALGCDSEMLRLRNGFCLDKNEIDNLCQGSLFAQHVQDYGPLPLHSESRCLVM